MTHGQITAIARAICFAFLLLFITVAAEVAAARSQTTPFTLMALGAVIAYVSVPMFCLCWLDWTGRTFVRCRRCQRSYNINANCPGGCQ